jgi:L-malate glycosyltransferase
MVRTVKRYKRWVMEIKPKVLIIDNSVAVTGALKSIVYATSDLKQDFEFHFLIPRKSQARFFIEEKGFLVIHELPMKEISKRISSIILYLPMLFANAYRLTRLVEKNGISLIHVNDLYNMLPLAAKLFGLRKPYLSHIRFMPDRFPKILLDFWLFLHLRFATTLIAVSNSVQKQLKSHEKIVAIPNELPFTEKHPHQMVHSPSDSRLVFLYLSNFMVGKGQNYALEAFIRLATELPDWKLRFVGGDMGLAKNANFRLSLQKRAREAGVFEKTEWIGFTNDVENEFKQADVVLNFSESESYSIVCAEALFFGRPLIATDCGGPSEIVEHEETGILVANRDVDQMVREMKNLALNPDRRNDLGANARKRMRQKFADQNNLIRIKQIYNFAIANQNT